MYGEGKNNAFRRLKKEIAEATNHEDTIKPAKGIYITRIMLPYLTLCYMQDSSDLDLEIPRNPSGGEGAMNRSSGLFIYLLSPLASHLCQISSEQ